MWVVLAAPARAEDARELVVFGDSLSDPRNARVLTGGVSLPPFEPVPSFPYAIGGFHLSNGRTWVEQLAGATVTTGSSKPAFRRPGLFTNYAVGVTRARSGAGGIEEEALEFQIARYLADFGGRASAERTHVLFVGGNDLRDALVAAVADPTLATSQQILAAAIAAIDEGVRTLYAAGARRFVVVNGPDLGLVPAVIASGPQAQAAGTFLSLLYNQALEGALASLALPGASIATADLFTMLRIVVAAPEDYGLTEVGTPCLTFGVVAGFMCRRPDDYLFWDSIHPTRAGQAIIAGLIAPLL
jgi:phospholipase/lecithinase/hemolysin